MMLENMGLLRGMKSKIKEEIKKNPNNGTLKILTRALSDIPLIELLINKLKYDEALKKIEQQSAEDRESEEFCVLKCKSLFKLGKQQWDLKKPVDALASWEQATDCRFSEKFKDDIHKEIVTRSLAYAATSSNRPDETVAILEMALDLVKDAKIKLALGDALAKSGNKTIYDAYQTVEIKKEDPTPKLIAACEKAVKDIQKASELGSDLARKSLDSARKYLEVLKSWKIKKLKDLAYDAAKTQNWDKAIDYLTEAISKAGQEVPDQIRKDLAVCYLNRGMNRVNSAYGTLNADAEYYKSQFDSVMNTFSGGSCPHYGTAGFMKLADGRQVSLCSDCAARVQELLSSKPEPSYEMIALMQSGEEDIAEAAEIDPSDVQIKQRLSEVRGLLSMLGHPVSTSKPHRAVTTKSRSAKSSPAQQSKVYQTQKKQNQTISVQEKQKQRTTVKELLLVLFWILVSLILGIFLSRFVS
jgi:tetratricopeptide (TPR) repeat protein